MRPPLEVRNCRVCGAPLLRPATVLLGRAVCAQALCRKYAARYEPEPVLDGLVAMDTMLHHVRAMTEQLQAAMSAAGSQPTSSTMALTP